MDLKLPLKQIYLKVNFLDVNLDLRSNSFHPYRKPNDKPLYINSKSNHPPHVIKNLPIAINKRLSEISSSEKLFNENKKEYEDALKNSGYNTKLKMNKINPEIQMNQKQNKTKRKRNRKIIWYNPPYNMNLKTNIGKTFLKLIDKHFHKNHPLNKIINRKNVKISYSCCPNIQNIINSHNRKILNETTNNVENENKPCNCQKKKKKPYGK